MLDIDVVKLNPNATLPVAGSEYAAGYDLHALVEGKGSICILPGETVKIHTGLAMAIPQGYFGAVFARSGLAVKKGLRPANCVGVIDSDYRGEIIVALKNDSCESQAVKNGERIAQIAFLPYENAAFKLVTELNDTMRGEGGFGSTGTITVVTPAPVMTPV